MVYTKICWKSWKIGRLLCARAVVVYICHLPKARIDRLERDMEDACREIKRLRRACEAADFTIEVILLIKKCFLFG